MADYNISANITANTKGYEAGINKVQKTTKNFSASLSKVIQGLGKNGLVGAMGSIGLASAGLTATLGAVVKIAKQVSQTIGECTEAYKKQLIAERQLETAINNNPLVTGSAKKRLTEFADEMQKVSNYGDEELIPMMANLVSLGRTEEETMKIMAVAMDMSASGSMSLDTAINQLNATLNGNIGRLGQQNAELKGLTEEELKSGKAVEILGEKFKGLAQSTVDTSKQLKNIKGDFKEAIGEFTLPSSDMWNKFWIGFYEKGISVIKQFDEYMDKTIIGKGISNALSEQLKKIADERQRRLYSEDEIHLLSDDQLKALENYLSSLKKLNKEQQVLLQVAKDEAQSRIFLAKLYEDMDKEEAKRQKAIQEQEEAENEIVKLKEEYLKKISEQEAKWKNIKTITGEEVKNEEKIKFYQDSLVDLMTKAGGQITTNNQLYKDQIAIIQKLQSELKPEEKETSTVWIDKIRQQAIETLQAERETYDETVDLEKTTVLERYLVRKDYNEKILALQKEQLIAERDRAMKSVEGTANEYEEKARIAEYYNIEIGKLGKQYSTTMEIQGKKAGTKFGEGFRQAVEVMKKVGKEIVKVCSGIVNKMKSVFSKVKNIFEFNPDTALDNLLIFEDKVLTFFTETLPKLPQFFTSALQSISTLLQNVMGSGGFNIIGQIVNNLIETAISNIPNIVKMLGNLILKLIDNLIPILERTVPVLFNVLENMVGSIMERLPQLIKLVVEFLSNMIQKIVKVLPSLLKKILPNLLKAVLQLVKSLLKELPKIIKAIIDALPEIISTVIRAFAEFFGNLKGSDIAMFIKGVVQAVSQIAKALISNIAQIIAELIPVMIQIVVELIKSIPDILKGLATGVWEGIKGVGEAVWSGIKTVGEGVKNIGKSIIGGIKDLFGFATGTNNAPKGLAIVGEKGPELVNFKGGEKVYTNTNTQKILAGATGGSVFNVTFENTVDTTAFTMMKQLKQYQRNLAFNSII